MSASASDVAYDGIRNMLTSGGRHHPPPHRRVCSLSAAERRTGSLSAARMDGAKCSEMCVIRLPQREGKVPRFRMFYEACDGTTRDERGVWRIANATSVAGQNSK